MAIQYHRIAHLHQQTVVLFDGSKFASRTGIGPQVLRQIFLSVGPNIKHVLLSTDLYDHWGSLVGHQKELRKQAARLLGSQGGFASAKSPSWRKVRASKRNGVKGGSPPRRDCAYCGTSHRTKVCPKCAGFTPWERVNHDDASNPTSTENDHANQQETPHATNQQERTHTTADIG